jgi:uncharacterized membrane protein
MKNETGLSPTIRISAVAILTAVTALFTLVRVPFAPTRGYFNLSDVAIFFSALTIGPFTALLAGGLGTAMADIISGYAQWAPISFVVHGLQGLVIGLLARRGGILNLGLGAAAGTVIMCTGYLLAGWLMVGLGAALAEVPINLLQNLAGIIGGVSLHLAVKKAYPPIAGIRW